MSAFHRVDEVRDMPAAKLVNFAIRLFGYKGIIRALAEAEQHREREGGLPAAARRSAPQRAAGVDLTRDRVVPSDAATLMSDPAFAGQIERKVSPANG